MISDVIIKLSGMSNHSKTQKPFNFEQCYALYQDSIEKNVLLKAESYVVFKTCNKKFKRRTSERLFLISAKLLTCEYNYII